MSELSGISVLVVDDEDELREIFVDEFRAAGARVVEARHGGEAINILRKENFDVVLSDVRMPGGDGVSLMRNIKSEIKLKPLMFLCSGFSEASTDEVMALGVKKVFGKPFDWNEILTTVIGELKEKNKSVS